MRDARCRAKAEKRGRHARIHSPCEHASSRGTWNGSVSDRAMSDARARPALSLEFPHAFFPSSTPPHSWSPPQPQRRQRIGVPARHAGRRQRCAAWTTTTSSHPQEALESLRVLGCALRRGTDEGALRSRDEEGGGSRDGSVGVCACCACDDDAWLRDGAGDVGCLLHRRADPLRGTLR